jgi:hypothetical protein
MNQNKENKERKKKENEKKVTKNAKILIEILQFDDKKLRKV